MQSYSDRFFHDIREASRRCAQEIVPLILELVRPRSVIDVGCGEGIWLSIYREHGIEDILGVDGEWVDRRMLAIPEAQFLSHDLEKPLLLERTFDLVTALEVAEHLPANCAEMFVDTLTRLGPIILFSAAIPFQGGTHHVNEQWPQYWVEYFETKGYVVIDCVRRKIWQNEHVAWVYAQNTLLFARHEVLEQHPRLKRELLNTAGSQISLVHPKKYLDVADEMHRLFQTAHEIAELVPPGDTLILVDEGSFVGMIAAGRRAFPFLEHDGQYWGPPADDETGIRELERLREAGAGFMVFAWPAFWWLDYYQGLHQHLRSKYRCVLENDRLVVFDLRGPS